MIQGGLKLIVRRKRKKMSFILMIKKFIILKIILGKAVSWSS